MNNLDLFFGKPLIINNISIKHPTIREILDYGENKYNFAINLFIFKVSDFMVELDDVGKDYTKIDTYDMFINLCMGESRDKIDNGVLNDKILEQLAWLTGITDWKMGVQTKTKQLILYSPTQKSILDKATFLEIRKFLLSINCLSDKEKYNPANETTRKMIIDNAREEMKDNKKNKDNNNYLANLLSCLFWLSSASLNMDSLLDLHIYQIHDGILRLSKLIDYKLTMQGFYAGTIPKKNLEDIMDKIDWRGNYK